MIFDILAMIFKQILAPIRSTDLFFPSNDFFSLATIFGEIFLAPIFSTDFAPPVAPI